MRNNSWAALVIVFGIIALALFSSANVSFTSISAPSGSDPEATVGDTLIFEAGSGMTITGDASTDTITFSSAVTGSGTQSLFETFATTSGTSPVADSTTDTLTLTAGSGITITGDSGTDTVTIASTGAGSQSLFETFATTSGTNPVADSATDTLTVTAGTGITVTGDSGTDTVTIASTVTGVALTDDNVWLGSGGGAAAEAALADCDSSNVDRLQYDVATNAFSCDTDTFVTADITDGTILEADFAAVDAAADEECLTFETTGGDFEWQTCGGAGANSFETMNVPTGTDPVASSSSDTLNWTSVNATVAISGTASTDNIDLDVIDVNCSNCINSTHIAPDSVNFTDSFYGATLAGNPGMIADECYFTGEPAGGGFICEGGTANTFEQTYSFPDNDGSDSTNAIITDADTGTVTGGMIADDAILFDHIDYSWGLAGDPVMLADQCFFTTIPATGAIICEGSTADTSEQVYIFPDVNGADTSNSIVVNAAEVTAVDGRSLTVAAGTLDADAELYTDTHTMWFEDPTAADDFETIWVAVTNTYTITAITCESDQTVNFDLQVDDGTPADVNGSDIACTTFATDSSLAGDTELAAGERLDLAITSVSGTPTWVSISWTVTKND